MVVRKEEGGKPGTWIEQWELPTRCSVRNVDIWIRHGECKYLDQKGRFTESYEVPYAKKRIVIEAYLY